MPNRRVYRLDAFDFRLPSEQIALRPVSPRDRAKLLIITPERLIDAQVFNLPDWLDKGDMLVFNNSPVMAAQLSGKTESGKSVALLLCAPLDDHAWRIMMRGDLTERIYFSPEIYADPLRANQIRFNVPHAALYAFLARAGQMPLPPYIHKRRRADSQDREDYQTIYHQPIEGWGSIAAPTAGLHFTHDLLVKLEKVKQLHLTLHVGAGTFLPVRSENIADHSMQSERVHLSAAAADELNEVKQAGGRIIPVGTTSLRVIEHAADEHGIIRAFDGMTDLFINPGYRFKIADGLMTNFHLPKSTPLMLAAAMIGLDRLQQAYRHAIQNRYRFFSYGDACLLLQ